MKLLFSSVTIGTYQYLKNIVWNELRRPTDIYSLEKKAIDGKRNEPPITNQFTDKFSGGIREVVKLDVLKKREECAIKDIVSIVKGLIKQLVRDDEEKSPKIDEEKKFKSNSVEVEMFGGITFKINEKEAEIVREMIRNSGIKNNNDIVIKDRKVVELWFRGKVLPELKNLESLTAIYGVTKLPAGLRKLQYLNAPTLESVPDNLKGLKVLIVGPDTKIPKNLVGKISEISRVKFKS